MADADDVAQADEVAADARTESAEADEAAAEVHTDAASEAKEDGDTSGT